MTLVGDARVMCRNAALGAAFFCLALITGCSGEIPIERLSGETMGTRWSVVIANPIAAHDGAALQAELETALAEVNRQMSTYDPNSEISQFNASDALGEWVPVSNAFADMTARALGFSEVSGGAFDPTVAPAVNLWGFGPEATSDDLPSDADVKASRAQIGYDAIAVRAPEAEGGAAIMKKAPRTLDLSAIAKGHGVDVMYAVLDEAGYANFLVEIGGEVRVKGDKDGLGWQIAVEKPVRDQRVVEQVLALSNAALATSGDYRNVREIDGTVYSHTLDPTTARPVTHALASVTVASDTCAVADGWATTLLVLGPEDGFELAVQHDVAAMFITRTANGFKIQNTPRFARLTEGG
jgi:thiamine biosynthesis lipoprotein